MQPPALPMEPFAQMVEASTLSDAPPVLTTEWRRRRRRQDQEEETDDDARSVVSSERVVVVGRRGRLRPRALVEAMDRWAREEA